MFEKATDNSSLIIFGAQGIALGAYRALRQVQPQRKIPCFVVSKRGMNAETLDGVPVLELEELLRKYGGTVDGEIGSRGNEVTDCETGNGGSTVTEYRLEGGIGVTDIEIVIATPENVMAEIEELLDSVGLNNHTRLTSKRWTELMCRANEKTGEFPPLDTFETGTEKADIELFMAKFYKDKPLKSDYKIPNWITPIQVGAELTKERVAAILDSDGDNISSKNVNYSELTALYWVWKHRLEVQNARKNPAAEEDDPDTKAEPEYYGLVHYRRILELTDEDLHRLTENDVDVVLPYPMPYLPDIHAHHERYLSDADWQALLTALRELQPEYADKVPEVFGQQYLYNYNIMLARKEVLRDYCRWLFPVLQRTEELSSPKGWERADRYIGYMGETLSTLYFMVNKDRLNVVHKGCRFLV